jgi:hypothetical protein
MWRMLCPITGSPAHLLLQLRQVLLHRCHLLLPLVYLLLQLLLPRHCQNIPWPLLLLLLRLLLWLTPLNHPQQWHTSIMLLLLLLLRIKAR